MEIQNIRLGFATNSSSSHSVLIIPDNLVNDIKDDYDFSDGFGWNDFTLISKVAKADYFSAIVSNQLSSQGYSVDQINDILNGVGINITKDQLKKSEDIIDHQSIPVLPNVKNKEGQKFLKDFYDYLMQDNRVVVGGNDNDEYENPLYKKKSVDMDDVYAGLVFDDKMDIKARKINDYWILFNKKTGGKIRLSFKNSPKELTKLDVPELVDVKITDFCPFDCDFCYQGSTHKGIHGNTQFIEKLAKTLGENNVFEVALGGGETTMHPNFLHILKVFRDNDVVPNFTTKNTSWIRQYGSQVMNLIGSVAFSIETVDELETIRSYLSKYVIDELAENQIYQKMPQQKIQVQFVMGSQPMSEFRKIVEAISEYDIGLTLLGYKHAGRGHTFEPYDYSNWLDVLTEKDNHFAVKNLLKIDTALAAQYKNLMLEKGIKENTFHTTEGHFSLYVDAVSQTMAPSSYIGLEQSVPFDIDTWVEDYKSIGIDVLDVISESYKDGHGGKIIDESTKPKFKFK